MSKTAAQFNNGHVPATPGTGLGERMWRSDEWPQAELNGATPGSETVQMAAYDPAALPPSRGPSFPGREAGPPIDLEIIRSQPTPENDEPKGGLRRFATFLGNIFRKKAVISHEQPAIEPAPERRAITTSVETPEPNHDDLLDPKTVLLDTVSNDIPGPETPGRARGAVHEAVVYAHWPDGMPHYGPQRRVSQPGDTIELYPTQLERRIVSPGIEDPDYDLTLTWRKGRNNEAGPLSLPEIKEASKTTLTKLKLLQDFAALRHQYEKTGEIPKPDRPIVNSDLRLRYFQQLGAAGINVSPQELGIA